MIDEERESKLVWAMLMIAMSIGFLLLMGCANRGELAVEKHRIDNLNRPMVEIECPDTGCIVSSLVVHNPEQVKLPKKTDWQDVGLEAIKIIPAVITGGKEAYIIGKLLDKTVSHVSSESNETTTTTTENSNNSHSESHDSNDTQTNEEHHSEISDSYNEHTESHESSSSEEINDSYNSESVADSYNTDSTESTETIADSYNTTTSDSNDSTTTDNSSGNSY